VPTRDAFSLQAQCLAPHPKFAAANFDLSPQERGEVKKNYAVAMSGKTASILVFSVAALNGFTM
jgi:hypothetical protein